MAGVLGLALSGFVLGAAPSGAATDSPAAPTEQHDGSLRAGTAITLPDGSRKTLPKDWADMTAKDLVAIGIRPGMTMTRETARRLGIDLPEGMSEISSPKDRYSAAPADVQPMDAGASDGDVRNYVWGDNGVIQEWDTEGLWRGGPGSTYSGWWGPPDTLITTGDGTPTAGQGMVYSSFVQVPFHVDQQTYLCTTWVGISGKPCVDAH